MFKKKNPATISTTSHEAKSLAIVLAKIKPGESMTYQELSKVIGRDVQKEARESLNRARRMVQRDNKLVFEVEINVGLTCLQDNGIVHTGEKTFKHIRRTAKQAVKRLKCVQDYEALTQDDKTALNVNVAGFAAIAFMTENKTLVQAQEAHKLAGGNNIIFGAAIDAIKAKG